MSFYNCYDNNNYRNCFECDNCCLNLRQCVFDYQDIECYDCESCEIEGCERLCEDCAISFQNIEESKHICCHKCKALLCRDMVEDNKCYECQEQLPITIKTV